MGLWTRRHGRKLGNAENVLLALTLIGEVIMAQAASFYFTKEPKPQDALHGRSAMLRCEVNDPQGVSYSWIHNGEPVTNSERRFLEGGNLKFTAIDRTLDSGSFQCIASKNSTGEEERTADTSFNIKWLESGAVSLKSPESVAEIQCSSQVILRCNIDGHPRPTNRWYKDGMLITEKNYKINNKERSLTLPNASPDDNGVYYCCAKHAAGQVCSNNNFTLNIIATIINSSPTPSPTTGSSKSEHLNIPEFCQKYAVHVNNCDSAESVLRLVVTIVMGVAAVAAVVLLVNDIRSTRASMTETGDLL